MSIKNLIACLVLLLGLAAIISAQSDKKSSNNASGKRAEITLLKSDRVAEGFRKGEVLIDNGNYMVHASHRETSGMAEIHTEDTDIIYVLEGSATFVTGGTVVDPKTVSAGEIRGASIRNGEVRTLAKGDVVVVPDGVPHWFEKVQGPLNYYVVKVRRPANEGSAQ
jgi:glc operon protein GlcG